MARCFTFGLLLALAVWAQTPDAKKPLFPAPTFEKKADSVKDPAIASAEGATCAMPDARARESCWEMMRASYGYWSSSYQHRRDSFDWSLKASKIIFAVVLLLVLAGLVFAAIQFRLAYAASRWGSAAGEDALRVEMELSQAGVKVNSSVLGVVILVISMAFFYLYARYVYPIQEIREGAMEVSQGRPAPP